jgi:uncharacterized protein (DUF2141 family)
MKKTLFLFSLLLLSAHYVSAQETFKTQVTIKGISNLSGTIHALVTNDSSQFPSIDFPITTKKVAVDSSSVTFEFEKLIGDTEYSIVIFQDLNANEKMDMNGGRPTEPFGFSNYLMMGPPSWANCSFYLEKDELITISLYAFK